MMPDDGLDRLRDSDSVFLGAVGWPGVPDHVSLWGLLIPIRRGFDQYVNLRPCKLMPGVAHAAGRPRRRRISTSTWCGRTPRASTAPSAAGCSPGTDREFVSQQSILTRIGTDRIMKYAFELAMTRQRKKLTSATKSNGITFTMPYWDERFAEMAKNYPEVTTDQFHIDILCAHFVQHPDWFDVVVGSNLFGDILSDLGPAVAGRSASRASRQHQPGEDASLDVRAGAWLARRTSRASGICNPIGQIWSGAMMLEHLGEHGGGEGDRRRDRDAAGATAGRARATWAARPARSMSARRWRS